MDCSLPGSSVHGVLQARILEWVALLHDPGDLPYPGIEPRSPALQSILYHLSHQGSLAPSKCLGNIYGLQTADISVSAVISGSLASQTSVSTTWELVGNIESQAPHRPSQSESAA